MSETPFNPPAILNASGTPARTAVGPVRCPQCGRECPTEDPTTRVRSGGFGTDVHDVCLHCGYDWVGELTV